MLLTAADIARHREVDLRTGQRVLRDLLGAGTRGQTRTIAHAAYVEATARWTGLSVEVIASDVAAKLGRE